MALGHHLAFGTYNHDLHDQRFLIHTSNNFMRQRLQQHLKYLFRKERCCSIPSSPSSYASIAGYDCKPVINKESTHAKDIRILIAGGGIGGLVFALAAKRRGYQVVVFEKDMSAIKGEGRYRGPIQLQSNALAVLEAIDPDVAEKITSAGCLTGDRVNGLVDGISGNWYVKFDTFTPAVLRSLPVTRVITRMALQQILVEAIGNEVIVNDSHVIDFEDDGNKVTLILEDGQRHDGDLLVGADGISSKIRKRLLGAEEAVYSGFTCYSGIADYMPSDIDIIGYRIFLGHQKYFVSSDVGGGKMQWYAFHLEPSGGFDAPYGKKARLSNMFKGWCDNVVSLISATDEEAILRRDIYDRSPASTWAKGRVTLLGDSVHAMLPNMGQGGCMAIEDSYQLILELEKALQKGITLCVPVDIQSSLKRYERERKFRVAAIHWMSRMAGSMASRYRPYLDIGLGPLLFLNELRIPHPAVILVRLLLQFAMPWILDWMIGGFSSNLKGTRRRCCMVDRVVAAGSIYSFS